MKKCPLSPVHEFGSGARRCPNDHCKAHVLDGDTCPACGTPLDAAEPVCRTCTQALVTAYPPLDAPAPVPTHPGGPRAKFR